MITATQYRKTEEDSGSGQIKHYKIGICYFSAKHSLKSLSVKTGWLEVSKFQV
jgi:hypothetical protein